MNKQLPLYVVFSTSEDEEAQRRLCELDEQGYWLVSVAAGPTNITYVLKLAANGDDSTRRTGKGIH